MLNIGEKMDWKNFKYQKWLEEDKDFDHKAYDERFKKFVSNVFDDNVDAEESCKLLDPKPPWNPNVFYNKDGNMMEVNLSQEPYYGVWLTPQITLLIGNDSKEIVGVEICGIKQLLQKTENEEMLKNDRSLMV